jgi:hypothetical protein
MKDAHCRVLVVELEKLEGTIQDEDSLPYRVNKQQAALP